VNKEPFWALVCLSNFYFFMIHYKNFLKEELIDLHIHIGGAVAPYIMWELAHKQGLKLPAKNYWDFWQLITASPESVQNLDDYLKILHTWTEKIQSSPEAMERCIYSIIAKEYRSSNVSQMELRFNPMKRNKSGEMDLDHIIQATVHGMDKGILDYGVKVGLIFCLAREFPYEQNEIIVRKAMHYHKWGVVGIDMAGLEKHHFESDPNWQKYVQLFAEARARGLGITVHTGETDDTGPESVWQVLKDIKPNRIGQGLQAAKDEKLLQALAEAGTVIEICPSSNVQTNAVAGWDGLRDVLNKFKKFGVKFTINTDGPYLLRTNMKKEVELLLEHKVLTEDEIRQAMKVAREASFIK